MRYGDCLYYLSGARTKDAFPLMHSEAALLLQEQVSHTVKTAGLCPTEAELWRKFLDEWGVSPGLLARLPLLDVLQIRHDAVGENVRNTYGRLLNAASQGLPFADTVTQFEEAQRRLFKLLRAELRAQQDKHAQWDAAQGLIANTSWATGGLSTIASLAKTMKP